MVTFCGLNDLRNELLGLKNIEKVGLHERTLHVHMIGWANCTTKCMDLRGYVYFSLFLSQKTLKTADGLILSCKRPQKWTSRVEKPRKSGVA